MNIKERYIAGIKSNSNWVIDVRKELHKIPELDFNLPQTTTYISSILDSLGIEYKKNIGKSGIVANLYGKDSSVTIALRADMDALPIEECTGAEYTSTIKGQMHACGHDVHTAILLGVARVLSENKEILPCNVRLIFQPAEETSGGALPMIEDGCLEGVNAIFGLHVDAGKEKGIIEVKYGAMCASSTDVVIDVTGKSCHGAYPSDGIDAIVTICAIVTALQSVVSRNVDARESAVLSLGKIIGGDKENIVAENVRVSGTLRTLSEEVKQRVKGRIKELVESVAKGYGAKGEVHFQDGYIALINHDEYVDIVKENCIENYGEKALYIKPLPNMGVEDFAYYVDRVPGAFFNIGVGNKERGIVAPIHNNKFDIDEESLEIGVTMQVLNILSTYEKLKG